MVLPLNKSAGCCIITVEILYFNGGVNMGGLTAYIANLSMNMAQQNVQNQASISMLKNVMDSQEASSSILLEGLQSLPSPDGKGTVMDIRA